MMIARAAVLAPLLVSGFPLGSAGAVPTEGQVHGEERAGFIQQLQERQQSVVTLRAAVVQRKRHPLLKAEVVSRGILLFQRPNRLRWEVATPERTIIVIDGHDFLAYRPDRNEAERRDLREDFGSRAALEFLTAGIGLVVADLEKRFQVDLYREPGRVRLVLTPRSRMVGQFIASIAIAQHDADPVPRQFVVTGQKGEWTETTLTTVAVNPRLPEDAFALRLGPDVRVTDTRKAADDRPGSR